MLEFVVEPDGFIERGITRGNSPSLAPGEAIVSPTRTIRNKNKNLDHRYISADNTIKHLMIIKSKFRCL